MKCCICKKEIEEHSTTVATNGQTAHLDCAKKDPQAFAKMMGIKKAVNP